jgi:hypothetical protein
MSHMVNLVRLLTGATGNSTPITLGAAYSQLFMTMAEAGAIDGRTYTYLIVDGNNWELGRGVYTASGTTLARTTILASRIAGTLGTSRISLTGTAQVRIVDAAEDKGGLRGTRVVTGTTDVIMNSDQEYVVTYSNAGAIAASLAQAGTSGAFLDSWAVYVKNKGAGTLTITPATSTINGAATLVLATNQGAFIWSDGTNYQAFVFRGDLGTAAVHAVDDFIRTDTSQSLTTAQQGLALKNIGAAQFSLINGKIVESRASNIVTFAIKTFAGTDPSASDPVSVIFSDGSVLTLTAALSITSSNSSGTFGTVSSVPFRLWFCIFNDSGTLRLGIRNCLDPVSGSISGFPGNGIGSSIGGNNAYGGTWANGATVASKPFVIVGLAEYDTGLTTAGTYNVAPSRIVLFGPHIKRPGDELQCLQFFATTANGVNSVTYVSGSNPLQVVITPQHGANVLSVSFAGQAKNIGGAASGMYTALHRDGVHVGYENYIYDGQAAGATKFETVSTSEMRTVAKSTTTTGFAVYLRGDSTTYTNVFPAADVGTAPFGHMAVKEIMG